MTKSRRSATSATPTVAPTAGTRLSAGSAFVLNACFVAGLLVLSQLSLLDQRPVVRTSIVVAALFLLAWSVLLFGVLRRGQKVTLDIVLRRQHYLQACLQGSLILYWGYRFILRGSKGPIPDREPAQLYARACEQGWPDTCGIQ